MVIINKNGEFFSNSDNFLLKKLKEIFDMDVINKSYLLFWFFSLFEEINGGLKLISFNDLLFRMIANVWVFFKNFKINDLGNNLLNDIFVHLERNYNFGVKISVNELTKKLKKIYLKDIKLNDLCEELLEIVPYQSLIPFLLEPKEIKRDSMLDKSVIEKLSRENPNSFYEIDSKNKIIYINRNWFNVVRKENKYLRKLILEKIEEYYFLNFGYWSLKESKAINEEQGNSELSKNSILNKESKNIVTKQENYRLNDRESNNNYIFDDFKAEIDPTIEPVILREFMNEFEEFYEKFKKHSEKSNYEKLIEMFIKKDINELVNSIKERHYRTILKMYKKESQLKIKILNFIKEKKERFKEIIDEEFQNSFLTDNDLKEIITEFYEDLIRNYSDDPINYLDELISSKKDSNYIIERFKINNVKLKTLIELLTDSYRNPRNFNVINQLVDFIKSYKQLYFYKNLIIKIFERHVENVYDIDLNFLVEILKFNSHFDERRLYEFKLVFNILVELGVSIDVALKVKRYLAEKQLKEFFESSNERIEFWRNYIDNMIDIKIRNYNKTEALIMYFPKYDIVEFKDVGNALYIYKKGIVNKLSDLKDKYKCFARLNHQGWWQEKFKDELKRLGI